MVNGSTTLTSITLNVLKQLTKEQWNLVEAILRDCGAPLRKSTLYVHDSCIEYVTMPIGLLSLVQSTPIQHLSLPFHCLRDSHFVSDLFHHDDLHSLEVLEEDWGLVYGSLPLVDPPLDFSSSSLVELTATAATVFLIFPVQGVQLLNLTTLTVTARCLETWFFGLTCSSEERGRHTREHSQGSVSWDLIRYALQRIHEVCPALEHLSWTSFRIPSENPPKDPLPAVIRSLFGCLHLKTLHLELVTNPYARPLLRAPDDFNPTDNDWRDAAASWPNLEVLEYTCSPQALRWDHCPAFHPRPNATWKTYLHLAKHCPSLKVIRVPIRAIGSGFRLGIAFESVLRQLDLRTSWIGEDEVKPALRFLLGMTGSCGAVEISVPYCRETPKDDEGELGIPCGDAFELARCRRWQTVAELFHLERLIRGYESSVGTPGPCWRLVSDVMAPRHELSQPDPTSVTIRNLAPGTTVDDVQVNHPPNLGFGCLLMLCVLAYCILSDSLLALRGDPRRLAHPRPLL